LLEIYKNFKVPFLIIVPSARCYACCCKVEFLRHTSIDDFITNDVIDNNILNNASVSKKMKNFITRWLQHLKSGVHNHFVCYLPPSTGFISRLIFKLFFANINIPKSYLNSVRELEKTGIVILVNKYKSYFE